MRTLIQEGYLGGTAGSHESVYCYNLGDARYARALLGDRDHWVRGLPGGLMQNSLITASGRSWNTCRAMNHASTPWFHE